MRFQSSRRKMIARAKLSAYKAKLLFIAITKLTSLNILSAGIFWKLLIISSKTTSNLLLLSMIAASASKSNDYYRLDYRSLRSRRLLSESAFIWAF
jgi:hypothetical protein